MDIHQIMKNTTTDTINIEESSFHQHDNENDLSSHSSNTAPDRELDQNDTFTDSDGLMMSPTTKINNVKQKY